jgi:hypothetical protein
MSFRELEKHRALLRLIEQRLQHGAASATLDGTTADTATINELFLLAMLVYINRVSGNALEQPKKIQRHIDRGFALFQTLDSCERQFPVFVLGCEARTDEQRVMILDLIDRTEKNGSSRSFNHVRIMTQAIWAQDDLANAELNYWDKLTTIISCCTILPSLV